MQELQSGNDIVTPDAKKDETIVVLDVEFYIKEV